MLLTIFLTMTVASQGQPGTAVDRSGEELMRNMLDEIAAEKRYCCSIERTFREANRADFYPDGSIEIWRDGSRARVEFCDMWGSTAIIATDGKLVLDDQGFDPVTIKKVGKQWTDLSPSLESQGMSSSPWFYFMEGAKLLDRLDKDRAIVKTEKGVEWDSSTFGKVTLEVTRSNKARTWVIEFDNMIWQKQMFQSFPEWFDAPDGSARWRHVAVVWQGAKAPRGSFDVRASKGRTVNNLANPKG